MTNIPQRLRGIARNGPFDERRSAIFKLADEIADEIAAEREAPVADAVPAYGCVPWGTLIEAVCEAQTGSPKVGWERDPSYYIGHQPVSVNMNSLNRIVSKFVVPAQARINALEARQVPETANDVHIVSWPSGAIFTAGSLKQAHSYMDGAVPSCSERGVEPPVIVRYVPAETVPYEPQPDSSSSKERT